MKKYFISANELLIDSFKLAHLIIASGYIPDVLIGVWRGGTPIAIAVHEYLVKSGLTVDHTVIQASSYRGINNQAAEIQLANIDTTHDLLDSPTVNSVFIVDDVFDTGRSMQAIIDALTTRKSLRERLDLKIACPWFKPINNMTDIEPDYFLYTTEDWLVFPHELVGLSESELSSKPKEVIDLLAKTRT